ncbi:glycoside hydrolase family 13 protein [Collybiopsis luxurians FD-317 M1]|uniref:Glycoside hydrolase family 13 protein n=1 Tax=Collybiopsis luxurians FD-317 M1 TaxID=944289 RepID=A0A0D0C4F4_9AGAR|nr:glycoside hydrolase family 13 protein [Collybiopsis luxurians FD-317 M1]
MSRVRFDQYGDIEAFGVSPDWQRQLSKFDLERDWLREWKPSVMRKLTTFSCMVIMALDIDTIRIDKALQVTSNALVKWLAATRECAKRLGKNFYIVGEITGGDTYGSLYLSRRRTPETRPFSFSVAANLTFFTSPYFLRGTGLNALDGCSFHYSIYRALTSFLGMDGNLPVAYDTSMDFITAWNEMFINNDFLNAETGALDPRHMFGTSGFDVFRWPSLSNGTLRSALGTFVTSMLMPGLVMRRAQFYTYDSTASNYLFGALIGCKDDWNVLDHFDPTPPTRRLLTQFNFLRSTYSALQDGFNVTELGNWTYFIERPGSGGVTAQMNLWSIPRSPILDVQTLNGTHNDTVWLLMTNENAMRTWEFNCTGPERISSPYQARTVVRNLLWSYENYTLQEPLSPNLGCMKSIGMDDYGFKVLVPDSDWMEMPPAVTRFWPGHDARILVDESERDVGSVNVSLEFRHGSSSPSIQNVVCGPLTDSGTGSVPGAAQTVWVWNAKIEDFPDGVLSLTE